MTWSIATAQVYFGTTIPNPTTLTTGGITFQFTANASIFLDTVYCRFGNTSGTFRVWYSQTSLTGPPTVSSPDWTELVSAYTGTTGNNLNGDPNAIAIPVGGFLVNAGTTLRFYVGIHSGNVSYASASPGVDTFADGNVTFRIGQNISYAGGFPTPTIHPRFPLVGAFYRFATGRDLRPAAVIAPQTLAVGPNSVTVRYQNSAADPIFQADLGYQVDNNPPVLVPGYTFQSILGPGAFEDYTFTTPINITGSSNINLKVWSTNANNLGADSNPGNDTLSLNLCTGITGTFTVGGAAADYPDVGAAVTALNTCGVVGPVTFLINPGTYYGSYAIAGVPGAGGANSITFISATGIAQDVVLIQDTVTPVTGARHHFRVNGVPNVAFSALTFERTLMGTALSGCIFADPGTPQLSIVNCRFLDFSGSASSFNQAIRTEASDFLTVIGNYFDGFYYSVFVGGITANSGYTINGNISGNIIDNYRYAIYGINQGDLTIQGNVLNNVNSASTFGYGLYTSRTERLTMSDNKILGRIGNMAIYLINPNDDSLGQGNRVFNNEIAGVSNLTGTIITYAIYVSTSMSTSATLVPLNPFDHFEIVNNTVNLEMGSTSTSVYGGGVHILGGSITLPPARQIVVRNNLVHLRPSVGNFLTNIKGIYYAGSWQVDSLLASNNNVWISNANGVAATGADLWWVNNPVAGHTTVSSWQTASGRDTLSQNIVPDFISPNLSIPTALALDNKGTPISYVVNDVAGSPRSTTTPDIGAYEFVGLQFSQITVMSLADTLVSASRTLTATIVDTNGLVTTAPNGPRMYYRKNAGSWQVDSVPTVSGNNFTFTFNYTNLGGVAALDTIEYYLATYNQLNVVTTAPLGGSGTGPIGNVQPPVLFDFKLLGQANGNYLVGTSNPNADFPSITTAVNFLNNSLITGAVNMILIDSLYSTAESFPIVIQPLSGSNRSRTVRFVVDSARSQVTIQGGTTNPVLFRINGAANIEWNGASASGGRALSIISASTGDNSAVFHLASTLVASIDSVIIRNINIVGGSNTVTSAFGIHAGNPTISTFGTGDNMNRVIIENNSVKRAYFGIYLRGAITTPATNARIANNLIGDAAAAMTVNVKGIDIQNAVNSRVESNEIFNITGTNSITRSGIELGGTGSANLVTNANLIYDVFTPATNGANGVYVISGNNHIITNNVIHGIRSQNGSNISQLSNAFGIRLGSGTGHRVYYNSVHMHGAYTNASTAGAASAALVISSTVVTGVDIRNNVFSNNMTSNSTGAKFFNAVWLPTNYAATNLTINNNAYHVDTTNADYAVGRVGTTATPVLHPDVAAWRAYTSTGLPTNDIFSVPPVGRRRAPFVSNTNLNIPAGTTTGIESGGVVILALDTPNRDFNNVARPAGTGSAPDMGAYEFNGVALPDQFPPTIDSVVVTPRADQCTVTPRTIAVYARDNIGGVGVDSVYLVYTIDSIAQPDVLLTRSSGTALNGVWTGTLPAATAAGQTIRAQVIARDSLANFAPAQNIGTFRDDYISISAGNDTTIVVGDSAVLRASSAFGASGFLGDPTLAATTNCGGGFMFDLTSLGGALFITGFDLLPNNVGSQTVEVHYRIGSKNGQQSNQSAWIQEGTYTINPTNNTSPLNLQINGFTVPAGATVGVYLMYHSRYATGTTSWSNADLTITEGEGMCTNWTTCCSPRQWVGRIYYGSPITFSWATLGGTPVGVGDTVTVRPTTTTTYVLTGTDSICIKTDTVTVTVTSNNINDIGVSQILLPTAPQLNGPNQVKVVIENFGNQPATGFDVGFALRGATTDINTNAISRTVQSGDTIHHIFTLEWTPTVGGTVDFCAYTKGLAGDANINNDTTCVTYLNVSVEEVDNLLGRVYPNPADQFVKFELAGNEGVGTLEIRDNLGRVVLREQVDLSTGNAHEVKTEAYAAGIYNYRFILRDKVQHGQVVIRR